MMRPEYGGFSFIAAIFFWRASSILPRRRHELLKVGSGEFANVHRSWLVGLNQEAGCHLIELPHDKHIRSTFLLAHDGAASEAESRDLRDASAHSSCSFFLSRAQSRRDAIDASYQARDPMTPIQSEHTQQTP